MRLLNLVQYCFITVIPKSIYSVYSAVQCNIALFVACMHIFNYFLSSKVRRVSFSSLCFTVAESMDSVHCEQFLMCSLPKVLS